MTAPAGDARPRRRRAVGPSTVVAFLVIAIIVVAGCSPTSSDVPTVSPDSTPSPPPSATVAPTPTPPATETPLPSVASLDPGVQLTLDRTLLSILPEAVEGIVLQPSPDGEASLLDPVVGVLFSHGSAAIAVDPVSGDLVYAVALVPRSGFSEQVYREYRDSFDEGACSQAGGVVGNAEAEIGGHPTYIGTCAGGMHTYHVLLGEPGVLISASSVGDRRLGEALIAGLRP